MKIKLLSSALAIFSMALLTACGGGGGSGSGSSDPVPEGLWNGTTSTNRAMTGVTLKNGDTYAFYFTDTTSGIIGGVVHGTINTDGQSFSSSNLTDYYMAGQKTFTGVTATGTIIEDTSFSGTLDYGEFQTDFNATYSKEFKTTPSLASLAGTYDGSVAFVLGQENATVNIGLDGVISGSGTSGCTLTGSAIPYESGNIYGVSITFGGSPCNSANLTFNGVMKQVNKSF